MKTHKHFAVMAMTAVIAIGLAGCQTETPVDVNGGDRDGDGAAARMSLSFTVPTSSTTTRAVQDGTNQAALATESAINTVDVYIFKNTGAKATLGAHTRLALADFTETPANSGTFTLKADKLIETLSGDDMRVYVGANLGSDFNAEFADEVALLAMSTNVDDPSFINPGGPGSIYQAGNFTMFGNAVEVIDLKPYVVGDAASVTTAIIQLERVAAKVVVTATGPAISGWEEQDYADYLYNFNGKYTVNWNVPSAGYNVPGYDEVVLTYTFGGYRPVQNALQTYVAPNYLSDADAAELPYFPTVNYSGKHKTYTPWNGSLLRLDESVERYIAPTEGTPGVEPQIARYVYTNSAHVTDPNTLARYWYYIGENRDYVTPSANGRSTYVMVSTTVEVNREATYDLGADGQFNTADDVGIRYVPVDDGPYGNDALGGGSEESLYIVKGLAGLRAGKVYITANRPSGIAGLNHGDLIARSIAIDAGWDETPATLDQYARIYEYPRGYVHFPVYLDGYFGTHEENRYGVFRNQFLHVNITGILGEPGAFPGYPGKSDPYDDPAVDPTDPTDPNNPYAKDPTVPVDGLPSMLQVEFKVQPWYYLIKDGTILQ